MKSVFNQADVAELTDRINMLTPQSKPLWGKMSAGQMLAHCNVSYELTYEAEKHPKPNAFVKLLLRFLVKPTVTGPKPYPRNMRTAPAFLMTEDKTFEMEKTRLLDYLNKTLSLGPEYFNDRESHSFGRLSTAEWNTMFYKHLDHHLHQFDV